MANSNQEAVEAAVRAELARFPGEAMGGPELDEIRAAARTAVEAAAPIIEKEARERLLSEETSARIWNCLPPALKAPRLWQAFVGKLAATVFEEAEDAAG